MYKILRAPNQTNPNPRFVSRDYNYSTSKQVSDYLLCEECEQRFQRLGESWMMANCYRDQGTFRIRDLLQNARPLSNNNDIHVYETAKLADFDADALIYFAISVIWRAAVHQWRIEGHLYSIDLGPYEEPFREFLLGKTSFPDRVVLSVRVAARPDALDVAYVPHVGKRDGVHFYKFCIPGLVFLALVGGQIPEEHFRANTAPATQRFVSIHPKSEEMDFIEIAKVVQAPKK
jgi:hypothetical protein